MQSFRTPTLLAAAIAAVLAMPASAQQSGAGAGALEEIVVTAQKRAEAIQDVPISVVAVTGESLAKLNQTDFLAISGRTPTLQYSQAGGEGQLYIRGIGSNLLAVGADPSVAIHLDGVYLGRPNMGLAQFLDVDRIEVLRGPQGTLYGRNATGGTINMISKQPTQEWDGYVGVGFGSFSRIEAKGAVGGPLSETLSFRLAGRYVTDDGYVEDLDQRGGTHLDDQNLKAFRGILRWEPGENFRASLSWDHSEFDNANTAVRPLDNLGAAQALGAIPTSSLLEERNDLPTFMDYRTGGPTLTFDWDVMDGATLTSISAYKTFDMNFFFNTDGTEKDITRTTETFDTSQFSQELRLASNGDGRIQWLAGAYYFNESKKGALGLVRLNLASPPNPKPVGVFIIPAENDTEAWAVFGELSYKLTDTLKLTVGARYSDESKDDVNAQYNVYENTPSSTTGAVATTEQVKMGLFGGIDYTKWPASSPRRGSESWNEVTPKISLDWKPRDGMLLYASYTEGFKSGGYNDYQPSNPVFQPEKVKSFEVGAKTEFADGRVRLNVAAFNYDYKDLQVTTFLNSLTLVANATDATVQGVDFEIVGKPTDALELGASVSWLDATYDTFNAPYGRCNAAVIPSTYCPAGTTPGSVRLVNASGNRLNNAPELKGTAYAQYDWRFGNGDVLSFLAQVSYTDDIYFNAANDPVAMQSSYTLVDARIGYTMGNLEASVYGKNLTDEEYVHNIVQFTSTSVNPPDTFSVGNALGYPAPGRTYGLDITYRF